MSNIDENFLKDLQTQCLKEGVEHIISYRDALPNLAKDTTTALSDMMKSCHSLKGNLQAVGFLHCADYVHELETAINNVTSHLQTLNAAPAEDDMRVLEFLCSDAIQYLETYFAELRTSYLDQPEYLTSRKHAVAIISGWTASPNSAQLVELTPTASTVSENVIPFELDTKTVEQHELSTLIDEQIKVAAEVITEQVATAKSKIVKEIPVSKLYLLCKNGVRYFGIHIERVVEIVQRQKWNALPSAVDGLSGLMNLRGEVLPVIDMKRTLGDRLMVVSSELEHRSYIVVCHVNGAKYGFPVEDAQQVLELDQEQFQPADTLHFAEDTHMVTHFSLQEDKTILILDMNKAFAA